METARYDFRAAQGVTFARRLRLRNPDGSLMNLTGCTAVMPVTDGYGGPELLTLTTEDASIILGGVDATVDLLVSAEALSEIEVTATTGTRPLTRTGVYDLNLTFSDGVTVLRPIAGDFIIARAVELPAP